MGVPSTLFGGPCNKDPTIQGTIVGPPYFRKLLNCVEALHYSTPFKVSAFGPMEGARVPPL